MLTDTTPDQQTISPADAIALLRAALRDPDQSTENAAWLWKTSAAAIDCLLEAYDEVLAEPVCGG